MAKDYPNLIVVVPTRNRAHLAIGAIRSVLTQNVDNVRILVSDNSTIAEEAASLSRFCQQFKDERLRYIAPPEPLPMSPHWNWAMEQALRLDASHFTVLTDRMTFRPGALKDLLQIVERHPSRIVSYKHDRVADLKPPIRVEQQAWTGKVFEIRSARLLALTSQAILHESLPRMLNCVVPQCIVTAVGNKFGAIFDSIAPDFNFCYKVLALEDSILLFDKAILVHRALNRSTGQTCSRGIRAGDYDDFLGDLGHRQVQVNFAAPIPEIRTCFNAIAHEYYLVKQESKSSRFPEIDMNKYFEIIVDDLKNFEDEDFSNQMKQILIAHGWSEPESATAKPDDPGTNDLITPVGMTAKLKGAIANLSRPFLAKYLGIRPLSINGLSFKSSDKALAYAFKFPLQPCDSLPFEESLLEYRQIEDAGSPS